MPEDEQPDQDVDLHVTERHFDGRSVAFPSALSITWAQRPKLLALPVDCRALLRPSRTTRRIHIEKMTRRWWVFKRR